MASTSSRVLRLLSLLEARLEWPGTELAERLEVSPRTLRRDVEALRDLGYPIEAPKGPGGGYRLGARGKLPPLVLDDDQAIAIALALQTAPTTVTGIDDALARALTTLRSVMPARLKAASEDFDVSLLRNYWEFSAPPMAVDTLRTVGTAIRTRQAMRCAYGDDEALRTLEPHHLTLWAGRWYLLAREAGTLGAYRVDRLSPRFGLGLGFTPTPLTSDDITRLVVENPDRGDTPAPWPCVGSAVLDLPAALVARWAPGGSVVDPVGDDTSRLTVGAWSWTGVACLMLTFDVPVREPEPAGLRVALARVAGLALPQG